MNTASIVRIFSNSGDEEIISGLKEGGSKQQLSETRLNNCFFYFIEEAVRKHRITREDALTAYSEAMLAVIANIRNGKFKGEASLKTYTARIFYFKCVDIINRTPTNLVSLPLDDRLQDPQDPLHDMQARMQETFREEQFRRAFEKLGEKCREILRMKVQLFSDKQIAEAVGFNSADVAKASRLRCLNKLKELFQQQK